MRSKTLADQWVSVVKPAHIVTDRESQAVAKPVMAKTQRINANAFLPTCHRFINKENMSQCLFKIECGKALAANNKRCKLRHF